MKLSFKKIERKNDIKSSHHYSISSVVGLFLALKMCYSIDMSFMQVKSQLYVKKYSNGENANLYDHFNHV